MIQKKPTAFAEYFKVLTLNLPIILKNLV